MSTYHLIIVLFCFVLVVYGCAFAARPRLIYQPTPFIGSFILVFLGGGAALYYPEIYIEDGRSYLIRLIVILFPLLLLVWGMLIGHYTDVVTAMRRNMNRQALLTSKTIFILCLAVAALGIGALLSVVPFNRTGLYALIFSPSEALLLREETYKLLPSGVQKSVYTAAKSLFIPVGTAAAAYLVSVSREFKWRAIGIFGIVFFCIVAGINGARSPMVRLVVLALLVHLFINGNRGALLRFIKIAAVVFVMLLIFTMARKNALLLGDMDMLIRASTQVFRRIFGAPFVTGLWHHSYVDANGQWPITVIGFPLKGILGVEHINHFRQVGEWYAYMQGYKLYSTNMNTSFLFSQQVIFGLFPGTVAALVLAFFCELLPLVIRMVPRDVRVWFYPLVLWVLIGVVSTSIIEIYFKVFLMLVTVLFLSYLVISAKLVFCKRGFVKPMALTTGG